MQSDGFSKSIYHQLTTSELITGPSLKIYKFLLSLSYCFPMEKKNPVFPFQNLNVYKIYIYEQHLPFNSDLFAFYSANFHS